MTAATRPLALLVLLAGAALLAVAEFSTLYVVRVITAVPAGGTTSVGGHHGYSLLVVAVALVPLSLGATLGGSRPAAAACLILAAVSVVVVAAIDLPALDQTGLIGRNYEAAQTHVERGFYLESLGTALVAVGAAAALLAGGARAGGRRSRGAQTAAPAPD